MVSSNTTVHRTIPKAQAADLSKPFHSLPAELLAECFEHLDAKTAVLNCFYVCSEWRELVLSNSRFRDIIFSRLNPLSQIEQPIANYSDYYDTFLVPTRTEFQHKIDQITTLCNEAEVSVQFTHDPRLELRFSYLNNKSCGLNSLEKVTLIYCGQLPEEDHIYLKIAKIASKLKIPTTEFRIHKTHDLGTSFREVMRIHKNTRLDFVQGMPFWGVKIHTNLAYVDYSTDLEAFNSSIERFNNEQIKDNPIVQAFNSLKRRIENSTAGQFSKFAKNWFDS